MPCEILPLPNREVSFRIDGSEVTRWHFAHHAPRPFFWPIRSGTSDSLTRMGHPGAPNHDHHRSFWFAHHKLLGVDFWSEETDARVRQTQWYCIEESDDSATFAFELTWSDGHDPSPLVHQDVFASIRSIDGNRTWTLFLQNDFRTPSEGVAFLKSNFGILGLRVAKSLSVVFGHGTIAGADGQVGEHQLFGKPNRWIDYSGPIRGDDNADLTAGMTLIDAASNPGHGNDSFASWHVREDGWIGPSLSRHDDVPVPVGEKLTCRYALLVHPGKCDADLANQVATELDQSPILSIEKSTKPHRHWQLKRHPAE